VRNGPDYKRGTQQCPDGPLGRVFGGRPNIADSDRRYLRWVSGGHRAVYHPSSASCAVGFSPEFTVTVSWSRLPVKSVVLWHSLGDRSYTQTLNHQTQKGTFTVQLGFEPVSAVFYDRDGVEVARRSC
jgi:hypothetical protein